MMRRALIAAALGLAIGAPGAAAGAPCHEDAPCWNWRTMGNHERGVVTLAGRFKVIGPLAYDRLNRACRIDWTRTAKLRGDGARCDVQNY